MRIASVIAERQQQALLPRERLRPSALPAGGQSLTLWKGHVHFGLSPVPATAPATVLADDQPAAPPQGSLEP